mmetsp:Transcript_12177/g.26272  ORF Transcript_12177/g.26272 Transcript_12177/m.26272 type:complete len:259 (+) Transcript_12177:364-1140(+)
MIQTKQATVLFRHHTHTHIPLRGVVFLPSFSRTARELPQIKRERKLPVIHEHGTLRIHPHRRIQSANPTFITTTPLLHLHHLVHRPAQTLLLTERPPQEHPVLHEEHPPPPVIQPASHRVPRSERRSVPSQHVPPSVEDAAVVAVVPVRLVVPSRHLVVGAEGARGEAHRHAFVAVALRSVVGSLTIGLLLLLPLLLLSLLLLSSIRVLLYPLERLHLSRIVDSREEGQREVHRRQDGTGHSERAIEMTMLLSLSVLL